MLVGVDADVAGCTVEESCWGRLKAFAAHRGRKEMDGTKDVVRGIMKE